LFRFAFLIDLIENRYISQTKGKIKMASYKKATELNIGDILIINGKEYKVTRTVVNMGALGDGLDLELLDIAKDRYRYPAVYTLDSVFEVAA
jgi:hypothetical protein